MFTQDHPLLRSEPKCPLCTGPKEPGCVICWGCHNEMRGDYTEEAENKLDEAEAILAAAREAEEIS